MNERKTRKRNHYGGGANGRPSSRLLKRNRFVRVIRQIVPETAYLYDAVHLYERSLLKALDEDRDPRNGREMVATLYGVHYRSAMGYVYTAYRPLCKSVSSPKTRTGIGRFSTKRLFRVEEDGNDDDPSYPRAEISRFDD